jgi:hypothetical protein
MQLGLDIDERKVHRYHLSFLQVNEFEWNAAGEKSL